MSPLVMSLGLWMIVSAAGPDILLADFEGDYGLWKTTGDHRRQSEPASRELVINRRYLHLPVRNGARKLWMRFLAAP